MNDKAAGGLRWSQWSPLLLVAALLPACTQGGCLIFSRPIAPDGGSCLIQEVRFERFLASGEEAEVEFGLDEKCYSDVQEIFPSAIKATVEVLDPDGSSVPHRDGAPVRRLVGSSHYENVVKVTFTPNRPGTWTLSADFGMRLGKTVQRVEVVRWRGAALTRVIPWSVPADCASHEVTGRETALCLRYSSALVPSVVTSRGQTLEGSAFAVAENVLWRLVVSNGDAGIERLEDNGISFSATHFVQNRFAFSGALAVDGDTAWVFGSASAEGPNALLHLSPQPDGGMSVEEREIPSRYPSSLAVGMDGILLWANSAIINGSQVAFAPRDGGLVASGEVGVPVGASPEALWLMANSDPLAPNELRAARGEGGALRTATLTMPRYTFIRSKGSTFGAPLIPVSQASASAGTSSCLSCVVPRLEGSKIALESFDAGADYEAVSSATPRHAFARSLDGNALKVIDR